VPHSLITLRKFLAILLILTFVGLGTGAIEYVHNLDQHQGEANHDSSDCDFHCLLRAPLVLTTATPHLLSRGELLAIANFILPTLISQHTPGRIDCRGPPVC